LDRGQDLEAFVFPLDRHMIREKGLSVYERWSENKVLRGKARSLEPLLGDFMLKFATL
jgi:hypothetical protein